MHFFQNRYSAPCIEKVQENINTYGVAFSEAIFLILVGIMIKFKCFIPDNLITMCSGNC